MDWLDTQLSTYSQRCEHPLKVGLGYRGCRSAPGAADPAITLDLGAAVPINAIYLVPAQREFLEDSGIFPKRFTLWLKLLRLLPYRWYFALVHKGTGL